MFGAMVGEPEINILSILRLGHDAKRLSISFHAYRLWRSRNQLCSLNRGDESVLGTWTDPQRTIIIIGVCCQEKYRIQSFAAGVALIRYLLRSKFSHFSNYPPVEAVAWRVS